MKLCMQRVSRTWLFQDGANAGVLAEIAFLSIGHLSHLKDSHD